MQGLRNVLGKLPLHCHEAKNRKTRESLIRPYRMVSGHSCVKCVVCMMVVVAYGGVVQAVNLHGSYFGAT